MSFLETPARPRAIRSRSKSGGRLRRLKVSLDPGEWVIVRRGASAMGKGLSLFGSESVVHCAKAACDLHEKGLLPMPGRIDVDALAELERFAGQRGMTAAALVMALVHDYMTQKNEDMAA